MLHISRQNIVILVTFYLRNKMKQNKLHIFCKCYNNLSIPCIFIPKVNRFSLMQQFVQYV